MTAIEMRSFWEKIHSAEKCDDRPFDIIEFLLLVEKLQGNKGFPVAPLNALWILGYFWSKTGKNFFLKKSHRETVCSVSFR